MLPPLLPTRSPLVAVQLSEHLSCHRKLQEESLPKVKTKSYDESREGAHFTIVLGECGVFRKGNARNPPDHNRNPAHITHITKLDMETLLHNTILLDKDFVLMISRVSCRIEIDRV